MEGTAAEINAQVTSYWDLLRSGTLGGPPRSGTALEMTLFKQMTPFKKKIARLSWGFCDMKAELKGVEDNMALVMAAVRKDGKALEFAAPELREDRDIVKAAVKQNGQALQFASPELRKDPGIVMKAVKQDGMASYAYRAPE